MLTIRLNTYPRSIPLYHQRAQRPAAQNVDVQMRHFLMAVGDAIGNHPIAAFGDAEILRDLGDGAHESSDLGIAVWLQCDPVRVVAVLVVATPCPLILAVPVALMSGLSRAARAGILIKSGKALEVLAQVRALVIDKTGTLTDGEARIVDIRVSAGIEPAEMLRIAASLDQASKHIIAETLVAAAREQGLVLSVPAYVEETPGEGISGHVDGRTVSVGGFRYVAGRVGEEQLNDLSRAREPGAAAVAVAIDGKAAGVIIFADVLRPQILITERPFAFSFYSSLPDLIRQFTQRFNMDPGVKPAGDRN